MTDADKDVLALADCPFCGGQPSFTDVELKDERRYAEKLLRCCSIEMSATLSFSQYKGLVDAQIDHQLRSELVKNWNTRALPQVRAEDLAAAIDEIERLANPADDLVREALKQIESGSFEGASTLALAGSWKAVAEKFQSIARAALSLMGEAKP